MEGPPLLVQLFLLLLATKVGEAIVRRIGQPGIVGEVLGGAVVGPSVLNVFHPVPETLIFAEIGVVLLLFRVGLETRLDDLLGVGAIPALVGLLGIILPFGGGFAIGVALGEPLEVSVFLAAALVATSTGVSAKVMDDHGILTTPSGRVVLAAAIVDDVLAMLVLAIAVGVARGDASVSGIAATAVIAAAFIAIVLIGGSRLLRRRRSLRNVPVLSHISEPVASGSPFLPGVLIMLGVAALAESIGLAAIIGAMLAGIVVGESIEKDAIEAEVRPVATFFTPFFFGAIGAQIDLAGLMTLPSIGLLILTTAVAIGTKFAGAFVGALPLGPARAGLVGWGMVPRGEVGIVIAGLGLDAGAIDAELYSVVVGVAVVTTLAVPPLLPHLARRAEPMADVEPNLVD